MSQPCANAAMMRTCAAPILAEGIAAIPAFRAGAGRHHILHRLGRGVDVLSIAGFVVAVREQDRFVRSGV